MYASFEIKRAATPSRIYPEIDERVSLEAWFNHHIERAQEEGPFATERPVWLTPALASFLLEKNPKNRPLHGKIKHYAKDIEAGKFALNGTTIVISDDGLLNDGQNRCRAVIEAGKPVPIFFVFGVTRESRGTLDIGKNRTAGDILTFDGVPEGNAAAAVANLIYQYCERGAISTRRDHRPTDQQRRALFQKDDRDAIYGSLSFVGRKGLKELGGRAILAFTHFILRQVDREDADYFIDKVITGEHLPLGHPALRCRERLRSGRRLSANEKAELIFRGWNFFREGRAIEHLRLSGKLPKVEA